MSATSSPSAPRAASVPLPMVEPSAAPFSGLRVLDLADGAAGQFCGKLFADQGAQVRLAEPAGGSATRTWSERGAVPAGTSALFRHLNADKAVLRAPLVADAPSAEVSALAAAADVVIVDAPGELPSWLTAAGGDPIICHITPFGATGAYADWRGDELVFQAMSGVMYQNGLPGRAPLYGVGHRASCAAGSIAFIEAASLLLRGAPGVAVVDVSIAEVATSMNFNLITQYGYSGDIERRESRTVARTIVRARDGWVAMFVRDRQWVDTANALGLSELIGDPRFDTEPHRLAHWDEFEAEVAPLMAPRSAEEIVAAGQSAKAAVARAVTPHGLLEDPQLQARRFWRGGPEPYDENVPASLGAVRRLGPMFRFSVPAVAGETLDPFRHLSAGREWDGESPWARRRAGLRQAGRVPASGAWPLEGVKVLEIATAWAGPMAARVLAGLGADVVKVEGPARMDDWRQGTRGGPEGRYPDWEHGEHPYNRNCQFNTQNTNKRALGLDLKSPAGQALAFELAAAADVVLTNFRSGYLARIGITHERLRERNPGLVIIEMPAYGGEGPIKDHVALGPSMEMMAGMASLVGYGDGKPVTTGPAYLDPVGAFNAAGAVVSALALREVTGQGSRVEVAQREAALHWIGEEILEAIECGRDRVPHGNRSAQASPHGAFPTAGVDQWVAIGVADEQQFRVLAQLVDGLDDARFASLESRKAHEDELEACVAAWTAGRDKFELARLLQEAGVPAAPLMVADDLAASDFLSERGMLPTIDQPEVGARVHQGLPLHIDGVELGVRRPTPRFAEHNREILHDWLGLSGDPVEALYASETLSDRPSAKGPTR